MDKNSGLPIAESGEEDLAEILPDAIGYDFLELSDLLLSPNTPTQNREAIIRLINSLPTEIGLFLDALPQLFHKTDPYNGERSILICYALYLIFKLGGTSINSCIHEPPEFPPCTSDEKRRSASL